MTRGSGSTPKLKKKKSYFFICIADILDIVLFYHSIFLVCPNYDLWHYHGPDDSAAGH